MLEERLRHKPVAATAEVTMNLLDGVVVLQGRVSSVEAQRALSEAAWTLPASAT
jgi:osmotically-inducible protein OsmY